MEDVYVLNYDCIRVIQNTSYIKLKCYFHVRLINKLFYAERNPISSLFIETMYYNDQMNESCFQNLTSLKIKCKKFPTEKINMNLIHLQKLKIVVDRGRKRYTDYVKDCRVLSNLTHLSISFYDIQDSEKIIRFDLKDCTHLKYLKLTNVIFENNSTRYFEKSTNLLSLIRIFTKYIGGEVILHHENNSNLKYLKLHRIKNVELYGMTQLKTKIFESVENVVEY